MDASSHHQTLPARYDVTVVFMPCHEPGCEGGSGTHQEVSPIVWDTNKLHVLHILRAASYMAAAAEEETGTGTPRRMNQGSRFPLPYQSSTFFRQDDMKQEISIQALLMYILKTKDTVNFFYFAQHDVDGDTACGGGGAAAMKMDMPQQHQHDVVPTRMKDTTKPTPNAPVSNPVTPLSAPPPMTMYNSTIQEDEFVDYLVRTFSGRLSNGEYGIMNKQKNEGTNTAKEYRMAAWFAGDCHIFSEIRRYGTQKSLSIEKQEAMWSLVERCV